MNDLWMQKCRNGRNANNGGEGRTVVMEAKVHGKLRAKD
jgi:hypothetical protein